MIKTEWHNHDGNDKDISSCFYESKKVFAHLMKRQKSYLKKKTEDGEKKFFLSKLQYRLSFMVVDGAHSIKWTSRKSNAMLIKVE